MELRDETKEALETRGKPRDGEEEEEEEEAPTGGVTGEHLFFPIMHLVLSARPLTTFWFSC